MNFLYSRQLSLAGFLFCCALLGFAAYLQLHLKLLPCPLCVVQRLIILIIAIMFLIGALYTPFHTYGKKLHSGVIAFFGLFGTLVASRHVWLTLQPPSAMPTCSPTLEYMFQHLAVTQTLKLLLLGTDDCAKDNWRLLGLSIPEWTLIFFIGVTIFAVIRFAVANDEKHL